MSNSLSSTAQELLNSCLCQLPINLERKIVFARGSKPVEYELTNPAYNAAVCWEVVRELKRRGLSAIAQTKPPELFIRIWSESVLDADEVLNPGSGLII